ncbi:MAG: hypothetical protein N2039_06920, partial [Gemmataceae bacterium]|nr:hypothetical protein [Gemmataceae bacterium]
VAASASQPRDPRLPAPGTANKGLQAWMIIPTYYPDYLPARSHLLLSFQGKQHFSDHFHHFHHSNLFIHGDDPCLLGSQYHDENLIRTMNATLIRSLGCSDQKVKSPDHVHNNRRILKIQSTLPSVPAH